LKRFAIDIGLFSRLKVQLLALSTVVAVETQGKAGGIARVTSYRLQYSVDCGAFSGVLDAAGNEAVCKHIIHID